MKTLDQNTVRLQFDSEGIDWQELRQLFKATDLGGRAGDKIRRAFDNSSVLCFALKGSALVGVARAVSDGEYHATIYDVAVHPEFQRQGLGRRIVHEVLARLPVWRVLLVADGQAKHFYERLGFRGFTDVMALIDPAKLHDQA